MVQHTLAETVAVALAALFALAGVLQLCGVEPLRRAWLSWGYSPGLYRMMGVLELVGAALLAMPSTRAWGVALAAAVNFSTVVLLLKNRAYLVALPGIGVAAALLLTLSQWA
jgi:hypothetical protein